MSDASSPTTPGRVLVTGGTGVLGRHVVSVLRERARPVRVLSRSAHDDEEGIEYVVGDVSDATDRAALTSAVTGVDAVIHCAGSQKGDGDRARNLVGAITASTGRPHLVLISVVGADRVPVVSRFDAMAFGYFASKRDAEQVVIGSGLPWSILRATQFFDLTLTTVTALARMPVVVSASGTRFQPVEAREVAERLVELALGDPQGVAPDLGGPTAYRMDELVRSYLAQTGKRRPIINLRLPGRAAAAVRGGAILAPEHAEGRGTWEEFLRERVTPDRAGTRGPATGG